MSSILKRSCNSLSWNPRFTNQLAAGYSLDANDMKKNSEMFQGVMIWDIEKSSGL